MTRKVINESIRQFFDDFVDDVELCDEQGRVIASVKRSTPWSDPDNWVQVTSDISEEEWQKLRDGGDPGLSTQELLDYLKGRR